MDEYKRCCVVPLTERPERTVPNNSKERSASETEQSVPEYHGQVVDPVVAPLNEDVRHCLAQCLTCRESKLYKLALKKQDLHFMRINQVLGESQIGLLLPIEFSVG